MRFIIKSNEPQEFTNWKNLENDDWTPTYGELNNPVKASVFTSLLKEQGHLCCYCERTLANKDYHLEHLNPQGNHEGDDLDYNNFLCSCLNKTAKGAPLHCGKKKANSVLPVTPLQPGCNENFTFNAIGEIGATNEEGYETIRILGLDLKKLNALREAALEPFLSDDLTDEELVTFLSEYIREQEIMNPFISAIKYVFNGYIPE